MFGLFFQNTGARLRKIIEVVFIIYIVLLLVAALFVIGFAWLSGLLAFVISLVAVPVSVILAIAIEYLSLLPAYVIADTNCLTAENLTVLREFIKSKDEKTVEKPVVKINLAELPTWKRVEMLKRGQMVRPQMENGKLVCPICGKMQSLEQVECESCGMLFFFKSEKEIKTRST